MRLNNEETVTPLDPLIAGGRLDGMIYSPNISSVWRLSEVREVEWLLSLNEAQL